MADGADALRRIAEAAAAVGVLTVTRQELIARMEAKRTLSPAQADWLAAAKRADDAPGAVGGAFRPIPERLLPPGMRDGGIVRDHCMDVVSRPGTVSTELFNACRQWLERDARPVQQAQQEAAA